MYASNEATLEERKYPFLPDYIHMGFYIFYMFINVYTEVLLKYSPS